MLELYDKNGTLIVSNDDWATDVNAGQVETAGLAPSDPRESALARILYGGSYTLVVRGAEYHGTGRSRRSFNHPQHWPTCQLQRYRRSLY
jgi:hypothetical protein